MGSDYVSPFVIQETQSEEKQLARSYSGQVVESRFAPTSVGRESCDSSYRLTISLWPPPAWLSMVRGIKSKSFASLSPIFNQVSGQSRSAHRALCGGAASSATLRSLSYLPPEHTIGPSKPSSNVASFGSLSLGQPHLSLYSYRIV